MSLSAELADPARAGDVKWLLSKFNEVADLYEAFEDRTTAAETLGLWGQRFVKYTHLGSPRESIEGISIDDIVVRMDQVLHLMIDRWTSGNPSYLLALRKAMQHLLLIRETKGLTEHSSAVPQLVKHATNYARDDARIAFGSLAAMANSSAANCTHVRECLSKDFIAEAFKILVYEPSRSGLVGRSLATILTTESGPSVWFDYTKHYIEDVNHYQSIMTYFVEPMLMNSYNAHTIFKELFSSFNTESSPVITIGLLKASKNARLDVSQEIEESPAIKANLSSSSSNLRFDALELLCSATPKLTTPVQFDVLKSIMDNWDSLVAEGIPKLRADVCSALRSLLIRINTSKSQNTAEPFVEFIASWCAGSLVPGMPYRCLAMSTKLLELFVQYGFKEKVLTSSVIFGLVNSVTSDFPDIRESCVSLLNNVPDIPQVKQHFDDLVEVAYNLIAGGRTGDSGARLLQFLNERNPDANLGGSMVRKLEEILPSSDIDTESDSSFQSIYGYIIAIRMVPPKDYEVMSLVLRIWRICSPPLMTNAPEGIPDKVTNFCWKAIKESALLAEALVTSLPKDHFSEEFVNELLDYLALMLTDITHWGAFSAVPPAFIAVARLNPAKASSLVWNQINELKSRTKSRSVTRRSAGLPLLITSTLTVAFDDKIVDALFELATLPFEQGETEELELPQVHGMNCLRAVITDASITKSTATFIERALELSLIRFGSDVWSLRNCAAMMFTSLFKRLFGVRGLPMPANIFFQKYKRLQPLLSEQLTNATKTSQLQAIYPALAILAKLQTISASDATLSAFWDPVLELLGSPSWKIREMAALALVSMTHVDNVYDLINEMIATMNLKDQNELHGFGLAINNLLATNSDSLPPLPEAMNGAKTRLSKLISLNKCYETSTALYKIWSSLGGSERLIPFEELPKMKYLNPSVPSFEAEQAKVAPTDVINYAHGWSQVLRGLKSEDWTEELAERVLNDSEQLPDLQAQCLKALQSQGASQRLSNLAIKLLEQNRPACIRQEALVLAAGSEELQDHSSSFEKWLEDLAQFSTDGAPVESRRSAARALSVYLSHRPGKLSSSSDLLLYVLLRLLSDEEEDIREISSRTAATYLGLETPKTPAASELLILPRINGHFIASQLRANLIEDTIKAKASFESKFGDTLFLVEKESLFRDELRFIEKQAQFCKSSEEDKSAAKVAREILKDLDFSAVLQAGSFSPLVEAKARIDGILNH